MPANLPPHYYVIEREYREAKTPEEKLKHLEEMLTIMPKHKGTDKLRADLRKKISKLKSQSQRKKGTSRQETAYAIDKEGPAQVAVIGPPNTGKSSLVRALTNADPEVADFPHTTWKPTPGMAPYEDIQFQLIDTPPLTTEYIEPGMGNLMQQADILLIILDLQATPLTQYEAVLAILESFRIFPDASKIPEHLTRMPFVKKMLLVLNKMDDHTDEEVYALFLELSETTLPSIGISTRFKRHLQDLIFKIYTYADIIRVYTKAPGKKPEKKSPFVLPRGSTLEDLTVKVHKDFSVNLKFARAWGAKAYDGQMVQRDYVLEDEDMVELHM
jgi:ribosome-interacting GTPase 1